MVLLKICETVENTFNSDYLVKAAFKHSSCNAMDALFHRGAENMNKFHCGLFTSMISEMSNSKICGRIRLMTISCVTLCG